VKEVRAPCKGNERREHHAFAESPPEHRADDGEAGKEIRDAGYSCGVLVIEGEAVARQVGPPRQHMPDDEEGKDEEGFADRARIEPSPRGRISTDRGEVGKGTAVPVVRQRLERRIAIDERGRQVHVVAVPIGTDRSVCVREGVDGDVRRDRHARRRGDEVAHGARRHQIFT
jgi:hypothetical protein